MKKKLLGILFVILLLATTTVYAHGGNISGYNDKDSDKIVEYNGEYYGYHKENDEIHYHKVEWNEEKQRWQIKNSKKIVLEYDNNSTETDKYNRQLAWIWVDDELLQDLLIENGLAKIDYIYGNYKYVEQLEETQEKAKSRKVGVWQNEVQETLEDTENNITADNNESGNIFINLIFIICGMIILGVGKFITKIKNRGKEQREIVESDKREKNGN